MHYRPFKPASSIQNEAQRRRQLLLPTLVVLLVPVLSLIATMLLIDLLLGRIPALAATQGANHLLPFVPIAFVSILGSALLILLRLERTTLVSYLLISMWVIVTSFVSLQTGLLSFFPALLIIPICAAGLLIDGATSLSLTIVASVLIVIKARLEAQGRTPTLPVGPLSLEQAPFFSLIFWLGLFWTIAALTFLFAVSVQRAIRQSHLHAQALEELSNELEQRVQAQTADLERRAAQAEALHGISRTLTQTLNTDEVLLLIAEQAIRLLHFDMALMFKHTSQHFALINMYPEQAVDAPTYQAWFPALEQILAAKAPRTIKLACDRNTVRSAYAIPLTYGSAINGILVLVDAEPAVHRSDDEFALAEGLADHAAVALANAQYLDRTREVAVMEERTRLAREIHDTIAQGLTGIVVQLSAAQSALNGNSYAAHEHVELARKMARESLAEARRSLWNLRASVLERGDLADALRGLSTRANTNTMLSEFRLEGTAWPLTSGVESALLRICQESFANTAKHARATRVDVTLIYTTASVELRIEDNGSGIDPEFLEQLDRPATLDSGFGLRGMRERMTALGGVLAISSLGGVCIQAIVPRVYAEHFMQIHM